MAIDFVDLLIKQNKICEDDIGRAQEVQRSIGGHIGSILVRLGLLSESVMLTCWSEATQIPLFKSEKLPTELNNYSLWLKSTGIDPLWLLMQGILVVPETEHSIGVVLKLGLNSSSLEYIQKIIYKNNDLVSINYYVATNDLIEGFLNNLQHSLQEFTVIDNISHLRELAEEAPVIELVNNLFAQAADKNASDIHIDPQKNRVLLRFRIDGVLYIQPTFHHERFNAVISRIKLLANMDIAERRLPQDGRITIKVSGKSFDVRVSSLPNIYGETVVMRLLPTEQKTLSLASLGMHIDHIDTFENLICRPHGIFLVTGPTGSGKTTTLYTALDLVNDGSKKIITVEDPVEYQMENIAQVQVNTEIGLTFASALRTILRQDPDIVMVGEIRDLETAEIAVQASLTGHLVFSTLHTNDSVGAFTRLMDMGIDPFLVATPIIGVMAQRLIRGLCPYCAESVDIEPIMRSEISELAAKYGVDGNANFKAVGKGCSYCAGTGYKGRSGIYELIKVDDSLREGLIRKDSAISLWQLLNKQGVRTLKQDGLLKVWNGYTSLDEIFRVTTQ